MFTQTMFTTTAIALSVATVLGVASAASAKAPSKHVRDAYTQAWAARAMVPSNQVRHSSNPAFDVYDRRGHYVGSDPDPRVRMDLLRDPNGGVE
jgi:hypothetical protein